MTEEIIVDTRFITRELSEIEMTLEVRIRILHDHLGTIKPSARWLLRFNSYQKCHDLFKRNSSKILRCFITVD